MLIHTRMTVQGMTCGHCEGRVQKSVAALAGVQHVQASAAKHEAVVTHAPTTTLADIAAAIHAAGYEADAAAAESTPAADADPEPEPPAEADPEPASPADQTPEPSDVLVDSVDVRLDIGGMSCASCVSTIDRTLAAMPGVTAASVNLLLHRADVAYNPAVTDPRTLAAAVSELGYPASIAVKTLVPAAPAHVAHGVDSPRAIGWTLAVGVLTMAVPMAWLHGPDAAQWRWLLLLAVTTVVAGSARNTFALAWMALRRGSADMHVLVGLGAGVAYVASALVTLWPEWGVAHGLPHSGWYDVVPWVLGLTAVGRWLEERAKRRTTEALGALTALQPLTARVVRGGEELDVPLGDVLAGETVRVRPGERVPVDGVVTAGESALDASLLTGETVPRPVGPGDQVTGGTQNLDGALLVRALAVGEVSALARMVRMVEDAQTTRPAVQRLADRLSGIFTPAILGVALVTAILWLLFDPQDGLSHGISSAVAVLVIACPCALGLAVPTSIMVAVGRAAQLGVMVRTGATLERGHAVTAVVLDKTGTLTTGTPRVVDWHTAPGAPAAWQQWLVAAQRGSEHPLAKAIVATAASTPGEEFVGTFQSVPGQGVRLTMTDHTLLAGRPEWLAAQGVDLAPLSTVLAQTPHSVVAAAVDGRLAGLVTLEDPLRPTSQLAVSQLRALGLEVWVASGDRRSVVDRLAAEVGADHVLAQALPADKIALVQRLQAAGHVVAMVGDGINDAPALAQADVGVAMGQGTDVAAAAADLVLVRSDLLALPHVLALSRATMRNIRQNLGWAVGFNLIGVPLAAGVLWPVWHWLLPPMFGSLAMALSSVTVVTNALRLQRWRPPVTILATAVN